jgi:hypothetical protein
MSCIFRSVLQSIFGHVSNGKTYTFFPIREEKFPIQSVQTFLTKTDVACVISINNKKGVETAISPAAWGNVGKVMDA